MRRHLHRIVAMSAACLLIGLIQAVSGETQLLKARVADIYSNPMEGAKLFVYDSQNVRRPADFISGLSDRAGRIELILPPGKYWAVARYKADGKYGPLMPGDKHSGEPHEVDMTSGGAEADFVVADLRELGQKKRAAATDSVRLKGRVVDAHGSPVAKAVVFAERSDDYNELPEYVSAWTGDDGSYEIFLPSGPTYFIGVSRLFPLVKQGVPARLIEVRSGKIDIAIDINLTVQ